MNNTNYTKTPVEIGRNFEARVRRAFERSGYALIRKNYWKNNYDFISDNARKREYDIVMFNSEDKQVYIVECKAHYSNNSLVGLDLVKEFVVKLRNYNGAFAERLLVTDTDFTKAARAYASQNEIGMVNGKELISMESKRRKSIINCVFWNAAFSGLEKIVYAVNHGNFVRRG